MIQQITNGIKIRVVSQFAGISSQRLAYIFSYYISIENQSKDPVQLLSRHWHIFDSLKKAETVDGEGVIGEKPIIAPNSSFSYSSSCQLLSSLGSMRGYFNMINLSNLDHFKVIIPSFQLNLPQFSN